MIEMDPFYFYKSQMLLLWEVTIRKVKIVSCKEK